MSSNEIDLSTVREVLVDCDDLVDRLDGQALDERLGYDKAESRERRVQMSRDLQRLAHQLELAATLVRNEYWVARGGPDLIHEREDQ